MSNKMIQKSVTVKIENNQYVVKFPTVGQFIDIENMKMALTNGQYTDMLRSNLKTAIFATRLIDAIATFYALIPDLKTDLQVKSYTELDPFLAKKLVKAYDADFYPWYEKMLAELMKEDEDFDTKSEEEEEKKDGGDIDLN